MHILNEQILYQTIRKRPVCAHKGSFGRVVLIGGNQQYGGAIMMSALAAVNSGAGLTTVCTHQANHTALHTLLPEAMVVDWQDQPLLQQVVSNADILLIGPGLGLEEQSKQLLQNILAQQQEHQWLIIDGSAITLFAANSLTLPFPSQTVFTPHQMEWQRLSVIPIMEQTLENAQQAQKKLQATIVLKSHRTCILSQESCYQNPLGNPGMATGGTGDTLAGMIAGFLAQFPPSTATIAAAVYLHSYIGDTLAKDAYIVRPTAISEQIPYWMKQFETNPPD